MRVTSGGARSRAMAADIVTESSVCVCSIRLPLKSSLVLFTIGGKEGSLGTLKLNQLSTEKVIKASLS